MKKLKRWLWKRHRRGGRGGERDTGLVAATEDMSLGGGAEEEREKSKAEGGKVEGRVGGRHGGGDGLSAALGGMSLGAGERGAPIQAQASGQADDDGLAAALGGMSLSGGKQRAPGQRRSFDDEAEDDWVLIESELGDMSLLDRGNGVQLEP